MRILVTGATGFVGTWLLAHLEEAYQDGSVELFGTEHGPPLGPVPPSVRLAPCDLTDASAVKTVIGDIRPDRVFHLAGFASATGTDHALIHRVNVEATVSLLQALDDLARPCRVQLASSGYVYGATVPGRPAREDDAPAPSGPYAESKAAMEQAARAFARPGGALSVTVTRSFNHSGPRQSPGFVVPAFARQIARIEAGLEPPVVRVGNLDAKRDFLDVRDVVRAYARLLLDAEPAPDNFRIVNVASGEARVIQSLLDALVTRSHVPLNVETDPARVRPLDLAECVGDANVLRTLTGWQPTVPLDQTLADTLDYWRDQTGR